MKTLHLIRHAKSDWSSGAQSDFERPLNHRGKKDAPFMGQKLVELNAIPNMIISSTAKRAISTAKVIANSLGYAEQNIIQKDELYHATAERMYALLNELPPTNQSVMLVGHNPGITALSNYLTNDPIDNMVTTGIVRIDFDIDDWQEVIQGSGTKVFYIYPKMYYQ